MRLACHIDRVWQIVPTKCCRKVVERIKSSVEDLNM
jgi:hypothetical protein